jgi:ornithine carbamoyltransferase
VTVLSGPNRAFDLDDVDLFDLVGTLRLDRVQLVALLERARDPERTAAAEFAISGLPCGATPVLELRRPVHLLADLLTMVEHAHRPLERISVGYIGDGESDIARSLLLAGTMLGMDVRIGAPAAMWPADDLVETAQDLAAESGARLLITPDAGHAARGAMFVVVGAWAQGTVVTGGAGKASPAYLVTEDFLSTGDLSSRALISGGTADSVSDVPRRLQPVQATNRRRVMAAMLSGWVRG